MLKMTKKDITYKPLSPKKFQNLVLNWFDKHGRKTLPWQENKTPYRVWVSEIMLQQTQVSTVIPYFQRFLEQFPTVASLALATEDAVLHLWTGLGYYSRARNLHRTAKSILHDHMCQFPDSLEELQKLPGIGRSTAGAIRAIAFGEKATILDGNVKRVLTRLHGITEWPGENKITNGLWSLAEKYTPQKRIADYTQAMMDIGATLCIRGTPRCQECPLQKSCVAHQLGIEKSLPKKKPKKKIPVRQATMLVFLNHDRQRVLLEKRPAKGIWGGLWSLPEISGTAGAEEIRRAAALHFKYRIDDIKFGASFRHTFSHFHLDILPAFISVAKTTGKIMEADQQIWYNLQQPDAIGLPAPIKTLLMELLK
jgi:A/G-specific adenine glycosylase